MKELIGTGVALITPFKEDFSVDVAGLKKVVNYNIDNGTNYLVVMGTTAENATLNTKEKQLVIDTIIETNNGKLPLVLGIGGNNTAAVIEEMKTRDLSAFTAILSVSPASINPHKKGFIIILLPLQKRLHYQLCCITFRVERRLICCQKLLLNWRKIIKISLELKKQQAI